MSQLCCDAHPRYRAGCDACNARARLYVNRRRLAVLQGRRFSASAELCGQRLRELRAAGYPRSFLAYELNIGEKTIWALCSGQQGFVTLGVFHRIEEGYRMLRDFPGGDIRAARSAQKHGWTPPPPLTIPEGAPADYVDEIAVDRAVSGERVNLTRAETLAAWGRLEARGLPAAEISGRLGVAARTVTRWRTGDVRPYRRTSA